MIGTFTPAEILDQHNLFLEQRTKVLNHIWGLVVSTILEISAFDISQIRIPFTRTLALPYETLINVLDDLPTFLLCLKSEEGFESLYKVNNLYGTSSGPIWEGSFSMTNTAGDINGMMKNIADSGFRGDDLIEQVDNLIASFTVNFKIEPWVLHPLVTRDDLTGRYTKEEFMSKLSADGLSVVLGEKADAMIFDLEIFNLDYKFFLDYVQENNKELEGKYLELMLAMIHIIRDNLQINKLSPGKFFNYFGKDLFVHTNIMDIINIGIESPSLTNFISMLTVISRKDGFDQYQKDILISHLKENPDFIEKISTYFDEQKKNIGVFKADLQSFTT